MAARIKGATILNTLGVLREIMDRQRFQTLVDACPIPTQQFLQRTLMAVEWVSVDVWSPMLTAVFERIAGRDEVKFRRLLRAVCKRDFAGPYRAYVQNTTAIDLAGKTQGIWNAYFDSGTLSAIPKEVEEDRREYLLELRGLESESTLYLAAVHAFIEQLLIVVDAKSPAVARHRELRRDNRLSCDYLVSFS